MPRNRTLVSILKDILAAGAAVALVFALSLFLSQSAQSAPIDGRGKVSAEVEEHAGSAAPDALIPLIVQTTGDPSDAHMARLRGRGGLLKARHAFIQGYSAQVPAAQIEALAADPEVQHISFDTAVKARLDVARKAVAADLAYADFGFTGTGVGVAVVDTGMWSHPDLLRPKGVLQPIEISLVGKGSGLLDGYGHGTHVAGIIAGSGASSTGLTYFRTFKGIAPGVQLVMLRALAADGTGYTSDVIAAIDWAIKNRAFYNLRVLNLSLGHPVYESYKTDPLCQEVRAANDAGMLVVVASGNDGGIGTGFGTIDSPGNEPSTLTVGAMDDSGTAATTDDVLAPYSSKGPSLIDYVVKPDLVAPGTAIVSLRANGSYLDTYYHQFVLPLSAYSIAPLGLLADGAYYTLSGTSMAAPMVSGAAALLFQQDPSLNPGTVKARLMASADKDDYLVFETGAGYLDIDAALKTSGHTAQAPSPRSVLASDSNVYMEDSALIWGNAWTAQMVWGFKKGNKKSVYLTDVPSSLASSFALIWGNSAADKAGSASLIWNDMVTASGLIWGGQGSSILSNSDMVYTGAGVWGGGGRH